jgi:hypothetical protein
MKKFLVISISVLFSLPLLAERQFPSAIDAKLFEPCMFDRVLFDICAQPVIKAVAEENQANIAHQLWQLQSNKLVQEGYQAQYSWIRLNEVAKALVDSKSLGDQLESNHPESVAELRGALSNPTGELMIVRDFTKNIEIVYGAVTYADGTKDKIALARIDENIRLNVRITLTKDADGGYHFDISRVETIKTRTKKPFEGNGSSSGRK